jgi:hypothetical protein
MNQSTFVVASEVLKQIPEYQRLSKINPELAASKMSAEANEIAWSLAYGAMRVKKNVVLIPMDDNYFYAERLLEAFPNYQSVLVLSSMPAKKISSEIRRIKARVGSVVNDQPGVRAPFCYRAQARHAGK